MFFAVRDERYRATVDDVRARVVFVWFGCAPPPPTATASNPVDRSAHIPPEPNRLEPHTDSRRPRFFSTSSNTMAEEAQQPPAAGPAPTDAELEAAIREALDGAALEDVTQRSLRTSVRCGWCFCARVVGWGVGGVSMVGGGWGYGRYYSRPSVWFPPFGIEKGWKP